MNSGLIYPWYEDVTDWNSLPKLSFNKYQYITGEMLFTLKKHLFHCYLTLIFISLPSCFFLHQITGKEWNLWPLTRIQSEYGKIQTRKNCVFGHLLRSDSFRRVWETRQKHCRIRAFPQNFHTLNKTVNKQKTANKTTWKKPSANPG